MDLNRWIESVVQNIDDLLTWDAMADWCEENGLEVLSSTLRLTWTRSRRPAQRISTTLIRDQNQASFDWTYTVFTGLEQANELPVELIQRLQPPEKTTQDWGRWYFREYPTKDDAFRAFLKALSTYPHTTPIHLS